MFYFQNYFALLIGRAKVENERQGLLMQGPGHFQTNTHGECSNWINQSWWISGHGIRCYCRWKLWSKGHYARFDKLIPTGLWLFKCKRAHVCVCVCVCLWVWKSTLLFLCKLIKMNVLFFQTQCIVRESLRKKKKKTSSWIGPFLKDKAEKISTYIIQNFMYLMHI